MGKRKLRPEDSCFEQFHAVRQIGTLTGAECRQVVQLLRPDDKGGSTCRRQHLNHAKAFPCLRQLQVPSSETDGTETAWMLSLPALVQAKVDSCPLYRTSMQKALKQRNDTLTLIFYQDEVSGGNILKPEQARKSNLTYFTWLEFPVLFMAEQWLTLSVTRSNEIARMDAGMANLTRAMLRQIRSETQNGFAIDLGASGEPTLCWIDRVFLLMDHEAIRAATGTKGAAGLKPCVKCLNVLSLGKALHVPEHEDISCSDMSKFWPASGASVLAAAERLREDMTKGKKKELEKFLGWNAKNFLNGPLTDLELRDWVTVEDINYDSFHGYYSNGIMPQELGLWYTTLRENCNVTLKHLQTYAAMWQRCPGTPAAKQVSPEKFFTEKTWKEGCDYRGDATSTALVLPLCVAFGREVLSEQVEVQAALRSLEALYQVTLLVADLKRKANVEKLLPMQQKHMEAFSEAYGSSVMRPKFHYVLHTSHQICKNHRHIDCWPCERKHQMYKARAASNWSNSPHFSKGMLLDLATEDLNQSHPAEKLGMRLLGTTLSAPAESDSLASTASQLEIKCVTYVAGQFVYLSDDAVCKIVNFRQAAATFAATVYMYQRKTNDTCPSHLTRWLTKGESQTCLAAKMLQATKSPMFFRENDDDTVALLL